MLLRKRAVQKCSPNRKIRMTYDDIIKQYQPHIKQHLTLFDILKITEISGERQTHTKALLRFLFSTQLLWFQISYATCVMYDWRMVLKDPSKAKLSITDLATNLQDHLHAGGKLMLGLSICIGLDLWCKWDLTLTCLTQANSKAVPNCVKNMNIIECMN